MVDKIVIESDLSEKQIELDISNYLGSFRYATGSRLRLLESLEAENGADALIGWRGRLLYFQFKKPKGLSPLKEKAPISPMPARSIRKYRFDNNLQQEPYSIYFQLRALAKKKATILQHNLLYEYDQRPNCRACYVVPTILKSREYEMELFHRSLPLEPFLFGLHRFSANDIASMVAHVPYLRAHAAIRPHSTVTTHEHHYSFSIHGGDVAFHSPEIVSREVTRFSDFLKKEIQDTYSNFERCPTISGLATEAFEASKTWLSDEVGRPNEQNSLKWLQDHGKMLQDEFEIRQFVLLLKP